MTVTPPSTPGTSRFLMRTFANVPRTITSWLPRRAPYELKSSGFTPREMRYFPAGLVGLIDPAGEMWSVVTESPNTARALAARMPVRWSGRGEKPSKYGGSWMYVLFASQAYTSPEGAGISFHSCASRERSRSEEHTSEL